MGFLKRELARLDFELVGVADFLDKNRRGHFVSGVVPAGAGRTGKSSNHEGRHEGGQ
jgi:hypothetical protein